MKDVLKACDWFFILLLLLTIFILLFLWMTSVKKKYNQDISTKFEKFVIKSNAFLRASFSMLCLEFFLEIGSVLSTIFVLYFSVFEKQDNVRVFLYSSISLVFIFANLIIQPKKIASGYRRAFIEMDSCINEVAVLENEVLGYRKLARTLHVCEEVIASAHNQEWNIHPWTRNSMEDIEITESNDIKSEENTLTSDNKLTE